MRAAVLGHPIAHSLSPVLHGAAYAALGLDWSYDAVDVTEEDLGAFVGALDDTWAGLSLTMPLKQAVLPLLDHVEPLAEVVGAVNTVIVQRGGPRPTLVGANTDVHGIAAALVEGGATVEPGSGAGAGAGALVLGAGATAASALAALAQLGVTASTVLARSIARAGGTMRAATRMGVDATVRTMALERTVEGLGRAGLVVSTLPPGAADEVAGALAAGGSRVHGTLLDCAYTPRPTALVAAWRAAGGRAVTGDRMLLHQAGEQVRLMTGSPAPLGAMDDALAAALRAGDGASASR